VAFELNKIQIIGRLGRNPEMRYTPQGTPVTNFTVAVGGKWTDRDGNERGDETEWFRIDVWNRLAELANEYLTKGQQVYIEGRFKTDRWTDSEGMARTTNKIVASNIVFLGSKSERMGGGELNEHEEEYDAAPPSRTASRAPAGQPARSGGRNQPQPVEGGDMNDDEIPF
jgi:single-strand DNA-binding protein